MTRREKRKQLYAFKAGKKPVEMLGRPGLCECGHFTFDPKVEKPEEFINAGYDALAVTWACKKCGKWNCCLYSDDIEGIDIDSL